MSEHFRVRLCKEAFVFSAAHFITYAGDTCEPLHGHNYQVEVEVTGPLDENHYVIDFIALRETLRQITAELDHRMLLPTQHRRIRVQADDREVQVTFDQRRWVFPRGDCVLLPVANTTAELLAQYIAGQLLQKLSPSDRAGLVHLRVAVDECHGQWGVFETRTDNGPDVTSP